MRSAGRLSRGNDLRAHLPRRGDRSVPAALPGSSDCGACGNACPRVAPSTADAACLDSATRTCGISCRGDNYDVDGDPADGCEVADPDPGNHDQASAHSFPATDCSDS